MLILLILLIVIAAFAYKGLKISSKLVRNRSTLFLNGVRQSSFVYLLFTIWLIPLPFLSAILFFTGIVLPPSISLHKMPFCLLVYLPVIITGKSLSKRMTTSTALSYELKQVIDDAIFLGCYGMALFGSFYFIIIMSVYI